MPFYPNEMHSFTLFESTNIIYIHCCHRFTCVSMYFLLCVQYKTQEATFSSSTPDILQNICMSKHCCRRLTNCRITQVCSRIVAADGASVLWSSSWYATNVPSRWQSCRITAAMITASDREQPNPDHAVLYSFYKNQWWNPRGANVYHMIKIDKFRRHWQVFCCLIHISNSGNIAANTQSCIALHKWRFRCKRVKVTVEFYVQRLHLVDCTTTCVVPIRAGDSATMW